MRLADPKNQRRIQSLAQPKRKESGTFGRSLSSLSLRTEPLLGRLVFCDHRFALGGEADPVNPGTTTTQYDCWCRYRPNNLIWGVGVKYELENDKSAQSAHEPSPTLALAITQMINRIMLRSMQYHRADLDLACRPRRSSGRGLFGIRRLHS